MSKLLIRVLGPEPVDEFKLPEIQSFDGLARILSGKWGYHREQLLFCCRGNTYTHDDTAFLEQFRKDEERRKKEEELDREREERERELRRAEGLPERDINPWRRNRTNSGRGRSSGSSGEQGIVVGDTTDNKTGGASSRADYDLAVVVLIRFLVVVQVLSFRKTRFELWLPAANTRTIPRERLEKKFLDQLKTLSPVLHWATRVKRIIGSAVLMDEEEGDINGVEQNENVEEEREEVQEGAGERESVMEGEEHRISEESGDSAGVRRRRGDGGTARTGSGTARDVEGRSSASSSTPAAATAAASSAPNDLPRPPDKIRKSRKNDPPAPQWTRAVIQTDYRLVQEDLLIVVPQYQLLWRVFYYFLLAVWTVMAFFLSFYRPGYRPNPELGQEYVERQGPDPRTLNRRAIRVEDGRAYRHHRYTPGNNPHGEDMTLMFQQAMFGI